MMFDFSIITPTFGRPASLARLLHCLALLDYSPEKFEVIVIDDGGSVPLEATVRQFQDRLHLKLLSQRNLGPSAGRNYGARESRGRYLAFTDDDCLPAAGWLREFARALEETPTAVCGGRTTNLHTGNLPAQATQLLIDYLYENYNPIRRAGAFFPTNNMCAPRDEFLAMGGFDEDLRYGEDREFCHRWRSRGGGFAYAPQAVVQHAHRLRLGEFVRLHFCYGGGTAAFRGACRWKGMETVGYSSPLWYLGLLLCGVKREPGWRGAALSLLLLVSQAATLAGLLWAWPGRRTCETPGDVETH